MYFNKKTGRFRLEISEDGCKMHDYHHGCKIFIYSRQDDQMYEKHFVLSVEELHDLKHLIERGIIHAGSK